MSAVKRIQRWSIGLLALCLMLSAVNLLPARAKEPGRTVRVGWYESPFNQTDEQGRRSGYAYEYQQKIAAYTGWTYEYVEGSWSELMEMLKEGRIDLLSDVSYTRERSDQMLFSALPMGTEDYYVFVSPGNTEIDPEDLSTFNGKKAGVNQGSVQAEQFRQWIKSNNLQVEIVEMKETVADILTMLTTGVVDMYVVLDSYLDIKHAVPICKIGSSDFYFAVNSAYPDLLSELNSAMARIQDENEYYNQKLNSKYIKTAGENLYLNREQSHWLEEHGPIRVGYQDNYLAFCAKNPTTGALTGALKDYLSVGAECLQNAHLDFQATGYPTAAAAMEALQQGEVDCVFPVNLTDYDGETQGVFVTPSLMRTDMLAVIRSSDQKAFAKMDRVVVAVNAGNPNYDMFLVDHFPDWRSIYFENTPECLRAVANGRADCLLVSNYRYNNIAPLCQKYHLSTLSTGVEMDYCFAVRRGDNALYGILSKVISIVPQATVNTALTNYYTEDARSSLPQLLRQNLGAVISALLAVAVVILLLVLRSTMAERKASAGQQLISATQKDKLTGLYIRSFFIEYAEQMYRTHPDKPMDAISLNIEQFHLVNSLKGRSFGNQTLQVLGREILAYLEENGGIGGREESDHFVIYCPHAEDYHGLYNRLKGVLDKLSPNANIRLRMGVRPWQKDTEPQKLLEQAQIACSLARGNFLDHLVVYDEQVQARDELEQRLLNDLPSALESRQFVVYYQPKYDIQTDPPALKSAEALVRWQHPELGMIPPGDFIPLLERSGEISAVDQYVWREAARQVALWKEKYGVTLPVSVNLSRLDVFDPTLENVLDSLLEQYGLTCHDLKLEVTESACCENGTQIVNLIERLRRKGFEIEMDDFGSGYSSLNMLSSMPIDVLKMDKAFVSNIEHEEKDLQLVEMILGIAGHLKVPVIAEGVETESQLHMLKKLGCSLVQGYYFARPLPAQEFEANILRK